MGTDLILYIITFFVIIFVGFIIISWLMCLAPCCWCLIKPNKRKKEYRLRLLPAEKRTSIKTQLGCVHDTQRLLDEDDDSISISLSMDQINTYV